MPRKPSPQLQAVTLSGSPNTLQARPKGKLVALKPKANGEQTSMFEAQSEAQCPLCCEEMDQTDMQFLPCPCGFKLCLFCYQRVQNDCNNLCPGCRRPYGSEVEQSETALNNNAASDRMQQAVQRKPVLAQQRAVLERPPSAHRTQQGLAPANVALLHKKPQELSSTRSSLSPPTLNDHAAMGLPPASSWATAQSLSRTTSLDSESTAMLTSGDDFWPTLAESVPVAPARSTKSNTGVHLLADHDAQSMDMEESQESFKSTAQVTSMVSGVKRAVCVPLSLAAGAVEPYPEASAMLYEVKQAVRNGRLSSKDAAAQLVALLREKEHGSRPRSALAAGRTPPGFSDPAYRPSTASPLFSAMDSSNASSASSSPFSQVHHNGSFGSYATPAATSQSVWTDSGLPGVSFSMGMPPNVPQTVQALWHEPASTQANGGTETGLKSPLGYGSNWNASLYGDSASVSRYAPPGLGNCQQTVKASNVPVYKPLSLMNHF